MTRTLHVSSVVAWGLWCSVAVLSVAAWACWLGGARHDVVILLVGSAGPLSAAAAVAHIRCYMLRSVQAMLDGQAPGGDVRPLR